MSEKIDFSQHDDKVSPTFEISLVVYDSKGNPTNKRKVYGSDYASSMSNFWYKNRGGTSHKKNNKKNSNVSAPTTAEDAKKILDKLYKDTDKDMGVDNERV